MAKFKRKTRKSKEIIGTSFGDKPLRVVQSDSYPKDMINKRNERYAAFTNENRIDFMTSLIRILYNGSKYMG